MDTKEYVVFNHNNGLVVRLGMWHGHDAILRRVNGVTALTVGCRTFHSPDQARRHWRDPQWINPIGRPRPDAPRLIELATAICLREGWPWTDMAPLMRAPDEPQPLAPFITAPPGPATPPLAPWKRGKAPPVRRAPFNWYEEGDNKVVHLGSIHDYDAKLIHDGSSTVLSIGCREFESAAEAREHWANGTSPDNGDPRPLALAMVDYADAICRINGWEW